jgi:hypothetical protein
MEYVYFFREKTRPYVKIGMSKNCIESRLTQYKTYAPLGVYIVGFIETENATKLEAELHKKYSEKRVCGEFFNMTDDEVMSIINFYDTSFAEIVSMIKRLMEINKIPKEVIYDIVKEKYKKETEKFSILNDEKFINAIKDLSGEKLTNTEILDYLFEIGIEISSYNLGKALKTLKIEQKSMRVDGSNPKLVYLL